MFLVLSYNRIFLFGWSMSHEWLSFGAQKVLSAFLYETVKKKLGSSWKWQKRRHVWILTEEFSFVSILLGKGHDYRAFHFSPGQMSYETPMNKLDIFTRILTYKGEISASGTTKCCHCSKAIPSEIQIWYCRLIYSGTFLCSHSPNFCMQDSIHCQVMCTGYNTQIYIRIL